ncbi:MAG: ATP-binding protein, partial [Cyanobacteria bacterium J06648_11]
LVWVANVKLLQGFQSVTERNKESLTSPRGVLWATRTRILVWYAIFAVAFVALSVPIFNQLILVRTDRRVREDLLEDVESFATAYDAWEASGEHDDETIADFSEGFFLGFRPEDDNFLIVLLDDGFFRSAPRSLPTGLQPGSPAADEWLQVQTMESGSIATGDRELGNIIYIIEPLTVAGERQGVLVAAHATAGEQEEATDAVMIFLGVAGAMMLVAFSLAWVATGRVLEPVQALALTVRDIGETNLSERLAVDGTGELADLGNRFNAMLDRLETTFESQRQFINDAGHEFRTPITVIRGHLELMGDDPDDRQETLELVIDELDRMTRFVNDMILLARSERPDFLQFGCVDIREFTEELFAKAIALGDRNWQLDNRGAGVIEGDRQRLTGAVMNLAVNAVQHTEPGDVIVIGTRVTANVVQWWVSDSGSGIPPGQQQRIFQRFARAAGKARPSEGAGLGLAIVKAIVEAHGGSIELSSQVGRGSSFTLELPLERSPRERISSDMTIPIFKRQ